jgi:chromate transporter
MADAHQVTPEHAVGEVGVGVIVREWGRLGCVGFGGPPAHVALLRELCVERRRWLTPQAFEDANAACNLLPGPASTQLAIFCAGRAGGTRGAVAGGVAFILPGLVLVILLAALTLGDAPPEWALGLAAGAGAAALAVVARAGWDLSRASFEARRGALRLRSLLYLTAGMLVTVLFGAGVVLALLACGLIEMVVRAAGPRVGAAVAALPQLAALAGAASSGTGALPALAWTALKVGALSYGGGFVIVPIMQGDAVDVNGWMTESQFLNAVALGQATPGPVVQTVAVVGYAAAGIGGAVLAAVVAFAPSFIIVALGHERFMRLTSSVRARAFLDGAGPAAIGAIFGALVTLAAGVDEDWQWALAGLAAVVLFGTRAGVVFTLLGAALVGIVAAVAGAPLPG